MYEEKLEKSTRLYGFSLWVFQGSFMDKGWMFFSTLNELKENLELEILKIHIYLKKGPNNII